MNHYRKLSYYYDEIMEDIHYEKWANEIKKYINTSDKCLDLACGTGKLAINLQSEGYDFSGSDLSDEAIEMAIEKMKMNHLWMDFFVSDMRYLKLDKKYKLISCFFDSMNFIEEKDLKLVFDSVYNSLEDNGYFIFDLFTLNAMKAWKHYTLKGKLSIGKYKWKMRAKKNTITHTISINDNGNKVIESYTEYYHDINNILDNRFKVVSITTDFTSELDIKNGERIVVVLQK